MMVLYCGIFRKDGKARRFQLPKTLTENSLIIVYKVCIWFKNVPAIITQNTQAQTHFAVWIDGHLTVRLNLHQPSLPCTIRLTCLRQVVTQKFHVGVDGHRRQAIEKRPTVAVGLQTTITNHNNAAVVLIAY